MPYSRIKKGLDLFKVAENFKSLSANSMEKRRVTLCAGNSELGVDIKQGIFQRDPLSTLVV